MRLLEPISRPIAFLSWRLNQRSSIPRTLRCGGRSFFYVKNEKLQEAKKITKKLDKLSVSEKEQMEEDVLDIIGDQIEDDRPVILDIETIKILQPGKYQLDLVDLFKGKPLVFKLEDGKYFIDIASTFMAKDLDLEEKKLDEKRKRKL